MFSERFGLSVLVTRHARERMFQRGVSEIELHDLLETGVTRYKDDSRLWIAKEFDFRSDNLLRVAVTLEARLVVKTVMHYFEGE
ncbi:DUF4258 domain-containing protein [Halomonas sp. TBZ9]|uniref:DUF4258 domain-containing protein n=1 Tax=Vreelandella azerica TaxID=2732867 RepID=A0A7Y3TWN8_9GAMM|nr:DUF4258 domain-containing protein [Halomonas azerica]NOG31641.1 DUF4258 domain-containing protein [Halomonas azerica]